MEHAVISTWLHNTPFIMTYSFHFFLFRQTLCLLLSESCDWERSIQLIAAQRQDTGKHFRMMCVFYRNYVHLTPHAFFQILLSLFIDRKIDWLMRMIVCFLDLHWNGCAEVIVTTTAEVSGFLKHCLQHHVMSHPHNTHTHMVCGHIHMHHAHLKSWYTHSLPLSTTHTFSVTTSLEMGGWEKRWRQNKQMREGWRAGPPGSWRGVGGILQVAVENKSILYWALCSHRERKCAKCALKQTVCIRVCGVVHLPTTCR